jgi:hypothetical protein
LNFDPGERYEGAIGKHSFIRPVMRIQLTLIRGRGMRVLYREALIYQTSDAYVADFDPGERYEGAIEGSTHLSDQ